MASADKHSGHEPIAVIGIGCRFPGGISDTASFWDVLSGGRDVISEIPENRLGKPELIVDPARNPGKIVTANGGFLEKIDGLDASFFNISPREAELMDPQQRVMLEITFEALEDAGVKLRHIAGTKTGVYVGQWTSDYENRVSQAVHDIDLYATTGTGRYATAGRLSYAFNLQGPSMTVDTACSSSLVTIHLASQALRNGDIEYAVAGGVNIILDPYISVGYSRSKILSDYGRCTFGDAGGSGYVRSEGAGMVVLKRLSDAERDGDHIYGVVRGSCVNSDGQSNKYLVAPSDLTQAEMLRDAYRDAGVDPSEVDYVEAHGTGTKAGDPVEFRALSEVIGQGRSGNDKCLIGSVKTNIGHTEAASGIAGFIKALLVLKHRTVPPSLHLKEPNPNIDWASSPFDLTQKTASLDKADDLLITGVNSFGITGTNAHIIIEEFRNAVTPASWKDGASVFGLPVSANSDWSLREYARLFSEQLQGADDQAFREIVHNIAFRKSDLNLRRFIRYEKPEALVNALKSIQEETVSEHIDEGTVEPAHKLKTVFVYPGQGSQWIGMGRTLFETEPAFREAILACEKAFEPYRDWVLSEQLLKDDREDLYDKQDTLQPTLFAMEIALTRLWQSWGIEPDAVVGHSMGEVAAAYIAGSLSLEDAAAVICIRSGLMVTLTGTSGMLYAGLSPEAAEPYIQGNDMLNVAINNSPESVVIGGNVDDLDVLEQKLNDDGIFCKRVKMDVASHSPQMDPLKDQLRESVAHVKAGPNAIPMYSSVQHQSIPGEDLDPDYWVSNLRSPVQFAKTIQQIIGDGYNIFVEISPHGVLLQAIRENAEFRDAAVAAIGTLRRDRPEAETFLSAIGNAWSSGLYPDWEKIYYRKYVKTALPNYPWDREDFWIDESSAGSIGNRSEMRNGEPAHPLLAHRTDLPEEAKGFVWETVISLDDFPYLTDHRVYESIVFPAAGYIEAVRAGIREVFGPGDHVVERFRIGTALSLPEKGSRVLQISFEEAIENSYDVVIRSRSADSDAWLEHASAGILVNYRRDLEFSKPADPGQVIEKKEHYELARSMNFPYGPAFQAVKGIRFGAGAWKGELELDGSLEMQAARYGLHPALLDGAIQVPLNISRQKRAGKAYLPVGAANIWFADDLSGYTDAVVYVQEHETDDDTISVDFVIVSGSEVLMKAERFELEVLEDQAGAGDMLTDHLYETVWEETEITPGGKLENAVLINMPESWEADENAVRIQWGDLQLKGNSRSLRPGDAGHWKQLVESISASNPVFVLNLASDSTSFSADSIYDKENGSHAFIHMVQALAQAGRNAGVWLIASGSRPFRNDEIDLATAPVWGMVNVLLNEHPELNIARLDLPALPAADDWKLAGELVASGTKENELVIRDGSVWAARLDHYTPSENQITGTPSLAEGRPYGVFQPNPGLVDDLVAREIHRTDPVEGEVEIRVQALGINFMNLMSVLGIYPGKENGFGTLGIECAGVVTKTGPGVSHLAEGDEVLGMCYHSMASHVHVKASLLRKRPDNLTYAEAAGIPVVFLTAYYALVHLGRISKGERILIHSATGGLGLAAIQVAQAAGAEIYATAGTEEKREFLRSLGVKYTYHSRTLDFAGEIRKDTNGEGIDLVLNSLTGEAMLRSMDLLRSFGRFLEVGKKDIYDNSRIGLEIFNRSLSYHMIDLEKMVHEAPQVLGDLLEQVLARFGNGDYKPLPSKTFPVDDVRGAFNYMSKAKHIGKIIIELQGRNPEILPERSSGTEFDGSATYLLTGGYGGIGLTFARWMAVRGARNLILVGRSGPKGNAVSTIESMKAKGVHVQVEKADVASFDALKQIIDAVPADRPLKGVLHLAGFLDDAAMRNMTIDQYHGVLKPKVSGAWSLHELTKDLDLDIFLLFASSSLLFGSPGQAAYVAANAFLDSLAAYRRKSGLPAQSIEWGTVAEVGLAVVDDNQAARLEEEGVGAFQPEECPEVYEMIAGAEEPVIGAFRFNIGKWQQAYRSAAENPFYEKLRTGADTAADHGQAGFREILGSMDAEAAADAVEARLKEIVSEVVKKPAETIGSKLAFKSLGIDSLMSIQLKNKLEGAFDIPLSVTSFWTYATIREYVGFLLDTLALDTSDAKKVRQPEVPADDKATGTPDDTGSDISDDDISDLLAAELEDLG